MTRPISSSLREVSTGRFHEQKHLRARRKRLHCRLQLSRINGTVKPDFTDNRLIRTPHYYGQFALSLGKEIPYNFSKFNPRNTDTPLIWTLFMPPSVTFLTGFNCSTFILLFYLTIGSLPFFLSEIQKTQTNDKPTPGQDTGFRSKRRPAKTRKRFGEVSYHSVVKRQGSVPT